MAKGPLKSAGFKVSTKNLDAKIKELQKRFGKKKTRQVLEILAERVLARSKKRAPLMFGGLRDAEYIKKAKRGGVRFGFNKKYASVMDLGFKKSVIRPIRGQFLKIPISDRAKRGLVKSKKRSIFSRLSRKPKGIPSGKGRGARTIKGRQNPDFIYVKQVRTPKAVKFQKSGPNMFFSGTLKGQARNGTLLKSLAKIAEARLFKGKK